MSMKERSESPVNMSLGKPAREGDFILQRRARLVRVFAPSLGGDLLDYGCGNGAQTLCFLNEFSTIVGVDVESVSINEFQATLVAREMTGKVRALLYDGGRLPLPDGSCDGAVSFEVLEHVSDERASLAEIRRVLRPDGWLVMTVPNRWWLFETHGASLPLLPWNRVPLFSWLPKRIHDRWARARIYRRREIRRLVTECGFTVSKDAYVTAPLDVLRWRGLRDALRRTLFRADTAAIPFFATAVLVVARRTSDKGLSLQQLRGL